MKYQDLKVRDMMRMVAMSAAFIAVVVGMLVFRGAAKPFLDNLPIYKAHHDLYNILLFVFPIMSVVCIAVAIQYLVTTPEQNARYIIKAKAALPPTLSEVDNPFYRVPTWKYILDRSSSQS